MFKDYKPCQRVAIPKETSKRQLEWIINRLMEEPEFPGERNPDRDMERLVIEAGKILTGDTNLNMVMIQDIPHKLRKRYQEWQETRKGG